MKKQTILTLALGTAAVVLAVLGWVLLPDKVAMQISSSGRLQNYMPKPLAVLLMLAVQGICILGYRRSGRAAYLAAAAVGLLMPVITLLMN